MLKKIPLFKIYEDEEDVNAVTQVIKRGSNWTNGVEVQEFEKRIAEYIGSKYALTFNSGTSVIHALLLAEGIGHGDEVIVPSFTFIATANSALFVNSKPVFSDIEEKTCGLDPEDIKEKITPKCKAIMPIHYAGCPCLIKEIKEIAEDHNLLLFEDAAESFGAKLSGKMTGTFGDAGILSFCQNKVITTGEGGALVTDSRELYEKMKLIRSHGRFETGDYFSSAENMEYVSLGYNFRLSSLSAALGISQLKKVDKIISMRRKNAAYMNEKLSHLNGVTIPNLGDEFYHVYQLYSIRVDENIRDNLINHLVENGISSKIYFSPTHLTSFYKKTFGYTNGQLPVTEKVSRETLTLPMFPELSKLEMDYIVETISNYIEDEK